MSRSVLESVAICLAIFVIAVLAQTSSNAIHEFESHDRENRPIFDYRRNGFKIDLRIVPSVNSSTGSSRSAGSEDDGFPRFPFREVGRCVMDFSLNCVQKRVARFLNVVGRLKEITLLGQSVKLVRTNEIARDRIDEGRLLSGPADIDQNINEFFDNFALRITLPRLNGQNNQIDVMMEDTPAVEGRGGKGGGKKGGGKKGGGKGGCKKMMMMMLMGFKMKMMGMIGMAAMKGMLMSGMSLMISKMMLLSQIMSKKGGFGGLGGFGGGGGGGGSGGGGGGGGPYKEIVLLTKGSGGGGGGGSSGCGSSGCGGGGPPPDSYGAPPASGGSGSYDNFGGGGGGGGGGWGRSFDHRPMNFVQDYVIRSVNSVPAVTIPTNEESNGINKPIPNEKWHQESSWKYTTEAAFPDQVRASQVVDKPETSTDSLQLVNTNMLQPMYAKRWNNYEATSNKNTDYYLDYDI